jgi:hypothetical protein
MNIIEILRGYSTRSNTFLPTRFGLPRKATCNSPISKRRM